MARKITMLEAVCRQIDTTTEQLDEALTDQRTPAPPAPPRRSWWPWRRA